jgi:hypothetical protein
VRGSMGGGAQALNAEGTTSQCLQNYFPSRHSIRKIKIMSFHEAVIISTLVCDPTLIFRNHR